MKKYFIHDGTSQLGPFDLEELASKNLHADTPIWYDGLSDWTTAGKLDELKDIVVHTPPPFHLTQQPVVEEVNPVEEKPAAVVSETTNNQQPVTSTQQPTPSNQQPATSNQQQATNSQQQAPIPVLPAVKPIVKSTAWISMVAGLVILSGTGFFVYWNMSHNNNNNSTIVTNPDTTNLNNPLTTRPDSTSSWLDSLKSLLNKQLNPANIDTAVMNMFTNDTTQNQP